MKKLLFFILFQGMFFNLFALPIDQFMSLEGFQDNPILGYGLVVGLNGTGDSKKNPQTAEMIASIAENFGFYIDPQSIKPKNTAVVLVTAHLSAFSAPGQKINVSVSSIYDAKSLENGQLIVTPLLGGDNQIYAIADGPLAVSKKSVRGFIPLGATVQKNVPTPSLNTNQIILTLKTGNSILSLSPIIDAINDRWANSVSSVEHNRITVRIPNSESSIRFINELLNLDVDVPAKPRITIDSKNGMLVAGGDISVSESLITFNETKIQIQNQSPWGNMDGKSKTVRQLPASTTLAELIHALNQIGASAPDIIRIIQLLQKNGNLKAEIVIE